MGNDDQIRRRGVWGAADERKPTNKEARQVGFSGESEVGGLPLLKSWFGAS